MAEQAVPVPRLRQTFKTVELEDGKLQLQLLQLPKQACIATLAFADMRACQVLASDGCANARSSSFGWASTVPRSGIL